MHNILTLNKISEVGLAKLPKEAFAVSSEEASPAAILVRSADMHGYEAPSSLLAVGRAGAGVNNIPVEKYADKGIVVFNTPGANANAVKELVVAGLLLSSRKIVEGINWVSSLAGQDEIAKKVEAGKSAFVGPEIYGKKFGVIGLGAIGVLVANACNSLGMQVYGYDPFLSVDSAWSLSRSIHKAAGADEVLSQCDYISVHVPLNAQTKKLFEDAFCKVKKGARLLNFSRGELFSDDAVKAAVADGTLSAYVTDFPNENLLGVPGIITVPHLGASTPESEDNCAAMAAEEIKAYLEYGDIKNSVNFPDLHIPYTGRKRICVLHRNVPNVVGPLTTAVADKGVNIDNMMNRSKGAFAYTVIDVDQPDIEGIEQKLMKVEGALRIRII
ncbi:MAG: phosphoglycerate dehydrogenase [Clostridiales bacterium]|jgi:D-3-phosphoglycerate dehydrogenase|nr:phosphoglycerate dehydrogenase [Clostridiales bacterium]